MLSLLQKCTAYQDLPTLQFWSKSHYPFWPIMQIRKKGGWNFKKIFSSETTEPISTKLCWNDSWMAPFQICIRWSRLPTKMAAKLKIGKKGVWNLKNLLLWNYWANLNQTLLRWSLGGPLPKLFPAFQTSDQHGRHSRT